MLNMFLGEYDHSLDERGRVTLPKKMRSELTSRELILSRGFEKCIFGFDIRRFESEMKKNLDVPITDREARRIRRYMFSAAEKVELDKIGRILVPAHLKEYAGIDAEVRVIGAGDHIELWEVAQWDEYSSGLGSEYE